AAAGAALGIAIQFALPVAIKDFLPVDVRVSLDWRAIAMGLGIGVWVALVFALRPLLVLWLSAAGLSSLARRLVTARWPYVVRQGVANLYRPANQTRSVVLALGFGAFLVSTLYLVQANLLKQFEVTAAQSKANLIFFDIQDDQRTGLDSILASEGQRSLGFTPIVTMKVAAINGRTPAQWAASRGISVSNWALRREFRSTFRDTMVATE